jgi:hypothetical protein
MRKHTNIGKPLELRGVRVIYRVRQITHRAITRNKRDQVIVIVHASKLKTRQEQNIKNQDSKSIKKGKDKSTPISETTFRARAKTRLDSQLPTRLHLCYYY